jgi:superfamily I DNA/RNA helicase
MFTLNQEQKQIVSDTQGAKLVISGPGTGKTTTITHFLAGLLAVNQAKFWR